MKYEIKMKSTINMKAKENDMFHESPEAKYKRKNMKRTIIKFVR